MGLDPAQLAASLAKSLEADRSPGATQRASEISQNQLADESVSALARKKPDSVDQARRDKIRQERERRRREMERRPFHEDPDAGADSEDGPTLDVVV